MFASQQINTDPKPWLEWESDSRYSQAEVDAENERDRCWRGLGKRPRPEFDNTPNPILLDFRENHGATGAWLNEITLDQLDAEFLREVGNAWDVPVTDEHIEHARKVLTRLAAFRS